MTANPKETQALHWSIKKTKQNNQTTTTKTQKQMPNKPTKVTRPVLVLALDLACQE